MTDRQPPKTAPDTVTLWLDPVCPFSWNTARWLSTAAEKAGLDIEWRLMSLAILNAGRESCRSRNRPACATRGRSGD